MKDYDLLCGRTYPSMSYKDWRKQPKYHSPKLKEAWKLTDSIRRKVLSRDGCYCHVCGTTRNLHIDHIIPISRGGKTEMSNLQVLCKKCNLQKGNKTMDEFETWRNKNGKTNQTRS